MLTVVGIDLSLTSTGFCRVVDGRAHCFRITSTGKKTATLQDRKWRLADIRERIVRNVGGPHLVVIEQPAYSRTMGSMHDRSGLWWLTVDSLLGGLMAVVEVPPSSRAKYATGKGNAGKDAVLAAAVRRYPDVEITGNDEADAVILAAMGCRALGQPIDDMPVLNCSALEKIIWPRIEVTV